MITFTNVKKKFGNTEVLKNINLHLPRTGLIVIEGPSGCGKTTLLNLISGLLPFEGDINVDGHHIGLMSQKEMDEFRLTKFGFIFQDFKLFEDESVINNIIFPLEAVSTSSKERKIRKCLDMIEMVGLKQNIKQSVSKLSGGEKQRVAIARALINGPKIILADEPTGSLDSKTALEIMDILEKVSNKSLVIVVSHDKELSKKYADQIIRMKDGKISSIKTIKKVKEKLNLPISRMFFSMRKPSVPSSFLFHHTVNSIKHKKWRTSICNMVTSLGLIGVGLAASLSSSISTNIKNSYAQILDDSKITISMKNNDKTIFGQYGVNYFEVSDILQKYPNDIYDIGVTYHNDFESFFPDTNCIVLASTSYYHEIEGLSVRHINEFRWLDKECSETIYPEKIDYLENDEVVLSLTIEMIRDICFQLRIERTVTSLSRYLQTSDFKIYFDLRNDSWQYSDQQIVTVKGFTLEKEPGIYHNNHLWNEYMFETRMRFPSTDNLSSSGGAPWLLKKIYYIYSDNKYQLLNKLRMDETLEPYLFEIANQTYYPWLFSGKSAENINRILVFSNSLSMMPMWYYKYFQEISDEINRPIFGSYGGYSIYPSSMLFGFSSYMYFSGNEDSIYDTIDTLTSLNVDMNESFTVPDDVASGHFSQSFNGGVNFVCLSNDYINGRAPQDLDEIVISSALNKKLFDGDGLNQTIHIAYLYSQSLDNNGRVHRKFKTTSVVVTGIVESDKNQIFHHEDWPISFFQIKLDVSIFNLGINSVMVDVKDTKNIKVVVKKLARAFPNYDVNDPMSEINDSVNQVCFYIQIALMCFSIIAVVISTLLLTICNYLYILENKKDIGLVRCLGLNKKEARKFVVTHSVIMCFISFFLSSIELFLISILISYEMSKQLGTTFAFSFNPYSLIYMFALAFTISVLSSLFIAAKINKLDPLEALKH